MAACLHCHSSIQEVYLVITLCGGLHVAMHSLITINFTMVMIVCSRVISVVDLEGVHYNYSNLLLSSFRFSIARLVPCM